MKRNKTLYFLFILFAYKSLIIAQSEEKLRFKKNSAFIYFFQKDLYRDTLQKGSGDIFYLIVPDSLKPFLSIQIENAQLLKTENDSLVKLNYVKGINYESLYIALEQTSSEKVKDKKFEFKTLVNGVSVVSPERIEVKFIDKREKNVLLKNVFYFKAKK